MMDEFSWREEENRLRPEQVDRIMDDLTAPQAVDPAQVPMNNPVRADTPEVSLLRAILFDAVQCVVKHTHSPLRSQNLEAQSAMRWISSNDSAYFLSFIQVCQRLGLEPNWIRRLVSVQVRRGRGMMQTMAA